MQQSQLCPKPRPESNTVRVEINYLTRRNKTVKYAKVTPTQSYVCANVKNTRPARGAKLAVFGTLDVHKFNPLLSPVD